MTEVLERPRRVVPGIVYRSAAIGELDGERTFLFVASTNTVDRYDDVIEQNWDLAEFWDNPVLLWGHQTGELPIGSVLSFETNAEKTVSTATARLVPEGQDDFVDQIGRLLKAKILRAVSVGFLPTKIEDRKDQKGRWLGFRYLESKLIELSIVSVPANPDAVQVARSLDLAPQLMRRIFRDPLPAEHGTPAARRRTAAELNLMRWKAPRLRSASQPRSEHRSPLE